MRRTVRLRIGRSVRDERGVALVLALLIVAALSISTAAIATLITSNESAFGRDRQELLAFNSAEAGINYGIATLAKSIDPNGTAPVGYNVAAMAFVNASLTAGAILLDDLQSRLYRVRDLVRLLFWAPFDMLLYRPIIAWARFKGTWRFLRGDKAWHKFERNVRAPA